jgi:hypothetical protein
MEGHDLQIRRQERMVLPPAPGEKMRPVRLIGAPGFGRAGDLDIALGAFGQVLQMGAALHCLDISVCRKPPWAGAWR